MFSAGSLTEDSSCQSCLLPESLWWKKWHCFERFMWWNVMIIHGWCYLRHVLMLQHISCQPSSYLEFTKGLRTVEPQLPGCCGCTMFYMSSSHKDLWITQVIVNYIQVTLHYPQDPSSNYELHSGNHALYTQVTTNYTHKLLWITHISCLRKLPEKHQKHIQHKNMQCTFHAFSNFGYNLNQFRMSPQNLTRSFDLRKLDS
jgi:hypothetical protein